MNQVSMQFANIKYVKIVFNMWKRFDGIDMFEDFMKKIFVDTDISIIKHNDFFEIQIGDKIFSKKNPMIKFDWGTIDIFRLEYFQNVLYADYTEFLYAETIYYTEDKNYAQFELKNFYDMDSHKNHVIIYCENLDMFNKLMKPIREEIEQAKKMRMKYEQYHSLPELMKRLEKIDSETIKQISQYADQFCKD